MNKYCFIKLLLLSSNLAMAQSASTLSITIAADPWCPHTCGEDEKGVMIEVAEAALAEENIRLQYVVLPWARAINEARVGKVQGVAGALVSDAPDFIFPISSIGQQQSCLFTNVDSSLIYKSPSSLNAQRLGLVHEYSYGEEFDLMIKDHKVNGIKLDYVSGTETARRLIEKLISKRVDVIVEDSSVVNYNLKKMESPQELKMIGCLKAPPLFLAFSPQNKNASKELAMKLDQGMKKLEAKGKVQEIFKRYGLKYIKY